MAVTTQCPNCHRQFGVHSDELGHAVRCQFCERLFMALEVEPGEQAPAAKEPRDASAAVVGVPEGLRPGNLIQIEAGVFMQGSQVGYFYDRPLRKTELTYSFRMSAKPVTQREYFALMYSNPSYFKGHELPVENVTWYDAMAFCRKLTAVLKAGGAIQDGYLYRLPTETEWEYACRTTPGQSASFDGDPARKPLPEYWWGDNAEVLDQYAWHRGNSANSTHPVAEKKPNPRGLYDMLGNVSEWCVDWFAPYSRDEATDPSGPEKGEHRSRRGGAWASIPWRCRGADRVGVKPECRSALLGFRVVLGPALKTHEESPKVMVV